MPVTPQATTADLFPDLPVFAPLEKPKPRKKPKAAATQPTPPIAFEAPQAHSPEAMACALEAHPDYRVLRRLAPQLLFPPASGPSLRGDLLQIVDALDCGFDRFATTSRIENAVEVAGCVVGQAVCETNRRRVRVRPEGEERQFFCLLRGGGGQTLTAVTRVDNEQTREPVDVLATGRVKDVVTFTASDDGYAIS
jgi:hypothetical protein